MIIKIDYYHYFFICKEDFHEDRNVKLKKKLLIFYNLHLDKIIIREILISDFKMNTASLVPVNSLSAR